MMNELFSTYRILSLKLIPEMIHEIIATPQLRPIFRDYHIDMYGFRLMMHEILANAVEHGHAHQLLPLSIKIAKNDQCQICIEVKDSGEGFEYPKQTQPYVENYTNSRGRGLAIIRAYGYQYAYYDKGNHICVVYDLLNPPKPFS